MHRTIEQFVDYVEATAIVGPISRKGCSITEIEVLERKYIVSLPYSYRQYLSVMGHNSSRLFTHDHMLVSYSHVLAATEELRSEIAKLTSDAFYALPDDALIIASRLGVAHWYIRCNSPIDSAVWCITEPDFQPVQVAESHVEWLYAWATEARIAIENGYYEGANQ